MQRVGDWIENSGKKLTYIYATHGHGDHWFGTDLLLQRFPGAVAYATEGTIAMMHKQATDGRAQMWDVDFPGQIPPSPVVYQAIPADGFKLEGQRLVAVEVGHTDTDDTTVLHVPSIGLVVAGDVAYNGVHQYLLESANGGIKAWLQALNKVEALGAPTLENLSRFIFERVQHAGKITKVSVHRDSCNESCSYFGPQEQA